MATNPERHKLRPTGERPAWWYSAGVEALQLAGFLAQAAAFLICGSHDPENLKRIRVCKRDPHHKIVPIFGTCHLLICPKCVYRKTMRLIDRYRPVIQKLLVNRPPYYKFQLITLTTSIHLRDPRVREEYKKLWSKVPLVFDKYLRKGWVNKGQGYIAASQFGEEDLLLHFHILYFGPFIDNNKLSALWQKLTGYPITQVKVAKQLQEDLLRILHYSTRLIDLEPSDVPLLLGVLAGHKNVRARGVFRGIEEEQKEPACCPDCQHATEYWSKKKYQRWLRQQEEFLLLTLQHQHDYLLKGNISTLHLPNFGPSPPPAVYF